MVVAVVLLANPAFCATAIDRIPKLLNVIQKDKQEGETEPKAVSPEQQREFTKLALTKAQAERYLAHAPGSSRQDLKEKDRRLDGLVTRISSQLNLIDEREEVRSVHTDAEQKAKNWAGF